MKLDATAMLIQTERLQIDYAPGVPKPWIIYAPMFPGHAPSRGVTFMDALADCRRRLDARPKARTSAVLEGD